MNESSPAGIYNLTIAADRLRSEKDDGPVGVVGRLSAEILSATDLGNEPPRAFAHELLYVALSGEGLIEQADGTTVIITAGDVVFVPAQARHRFTQLSRKFKTWKIRL